MKKVKKETVLTPLSLWVINKKGTPDQVPFKMPASSFGLTEHALHHFIPEHWHIQGFGH
jgi:hypothetical protein